MTKQRKFPLAIRLMGALCMLLLVGAAAFIAIAGINMASGVVLATAAAGLVAPCVWSAATLADMLFAIVELVGEAIATLVEAVVGFFASLFG
jgi:hypothetical protein